MREQIADDAGIVSIVLVPTEVVLGIEWYLRRVAEPASPIEIALVGIRIDRISPLAVFGIVAAIRALSPNQRTELARLDPFRGFVIFWVRATLRADDINLAGALDGVVNLKRFSQIPRHRLLAIDVLAGLQGVDRHLGMPVIDGGNQHGVDIFSVEQLAVIAIRGGVSQLEKPLRSLQPFLINITNGRL